MESERDARVRAKAYQLWEEGGRRDDSAEEDWAAAERSVPAAGEAPSDEPAAPAAAPVARKTRKTAEASPAEPKPSRVPAREAPAKDAPVKGPPTKGRGKGGAAGA